MATFRSLHDRFARDNMQLHDFLWHQSTSIDEKALRRNLLRDAQDLDAFVRAGGRLRRNAESLAKTWGRGPEGESLFELLGHTWHLAAAVEHAGMQEYGAQPVAGEPPEACRGAVWHAAEAAESMSIGVCANAGCFEFVEEWEGGRTNFDTYATKLAGFLEGKGVARAGEFKRMLLAARDTGAAWDATSPRTQQALATRAAIAAAAWCALAAVSIRTALGAPPKFSYDDYAWVVSKIAERPWTATRRTSK